MSKHYTWEEKIESLVKLAKAAGRYIYAEEGRKPPSEQTDYYHDAQRKFHEAYYEFCQWRHDEPYVVDEIWELLRRREYTDAQTGITLLVEHDIPEHPKMTFDCKGVPDYEQVNAAITRLLDRAGISPEQRPTPPFTRLEPIATKEQ